MSTFPGPKVFAIGLPKAGTVSLARALSDLGLRAIHNPWAFYKQILEEADFLWCPNQWDALVHFGTRYYAQLDLHYPNSLFILNTRSKDAWLDSCDRWWQKRADAGLNQDPDTFLSNMSTFGTRRFHRGQFGDVFDQHHQAVLSYFNGSKSSRLLVLSLGDTKKEQTLCHFLGRDLPSPDYVYPLKNANPKEGQ